MDYMVLLEVGLALLAGLLIGRLTSKREQVTSKSGQAHIVLGGAPSATGGLKVG